MAHVLGLVEDRATAPRVGTRRWWGGILGAAIGTAVAYVLWWVLR